MATEGESEQEDDPQSDAAPRNLMEFILYEHSYSSFNFRSIRNEDVKGTTELQHDSNPIEGTSAFIEIQTSSQENEASTSSTPVRRSKRQLEKKRESDPPIEEPCEISGTKTKKAKVEECVQQKLLHDVPPIEFNKRNKRKTIKKQHESSEIRDEVDSSGDAWKNSANTDASNFDNSECSEEKDTDIESSDDNGEAEELSDIISEVNKHLTSTATSADQRPLIEVKEKKLTRSASKKSEEIKTDSKDLKKKCKKVEISKKENQKLALDISKGKHEDKNDSSHDVPVKVKKSVSFSEEPPTRIEIEVQQKKRRLSMEAKVTPSKAPTMTPSHEKQSKKKAVRRDGAKTIVREEPPLFSLPDKMVKIRNENKMEETDSSILEEKDVCKELLMKNESAQMHLEENLFTNSEDQISESNQCNLDKVSLIEDKTISENASQNIDIDKSIATFNKVDVSNDAEKDPLILNNSIAQDSENSSLSRKDNITITKPSLKDAEKSSPDVGLETLLNEVVDDILETTNQTLSSDVPPKLNSTKISIDGVSALTIPKDLTQSNLISKEAVEGHKNKDNMCTKDDNISALNLEEEALETSTEAIPKKQIDKPFMTKNENLEKQLNTNLDISKDKNNLKKSLGIVQPTGCVNPEYVQKLSQSSVASDESLKTSQATFLVEKQSTNLSKISTRKMEKYIFDEKSGAPKKIIEIDYKTSSVVSENINKKEHVKKLQPLVKSQDTLSKKSNPISTLQACDGNNKQSAPSKPEDKVKDDLESNEPKPERKSRRIIKKKDFFGYSSDSSDDSKTPNRKKEHKLTTDKKNSSRGKTSLYTNADSTDSSEEEEEEEEEEDDPEKLWCICRKPHNSRFMIQCDKCEDWFHGSCVGVTKQQGRLLEKQKKDWNCPKCCPVDDNKDKKVVKAVKSDVVQKAISSSGGKKPISSQSQINSTNKKGIQGKTFKTVIPSTGNRLRTDSTSSLPKDGTKKQDSTIDQKSRPVNILGKKTNSHFEKDLSNKVNKKNIGIDSSALLNKHSNQVKMSPLKKQPMSAKLQQSDQSKQGVQVTLEHMAPVTVTPVTKKKISPSPKKKSVFLTKKMNCVQCQKEAKENACYCSDVCIEKHAHTALKHIRETKGAIKDVEFNAVKLVVFDRIKGTVITSDNGPTAGQIVSWLKGNPSYMVAYPSKVETKKESPSLRKEAESNVGDDKKDAEAAHATVRLNVRKTLRNILLERCKKADDIKMSEDAVQTIAVKIEEELNCLFKDNSFKYRAKYRSLMFNIKDPRNQGLFRKILHGDIPPDRLVRMSPEELASLELARWREQENQHVLDMIKRVQLEQQKSGNSLLFKKTHKGEVEIEDDLTSIIEPDVPKPITKEEIQDELNETETEIAKDTTHCHRSHLFDLNCKICTGKVVPPIADESLPKKVRVAHSISVDQRCPNSSDSIEKSVSDVVAEKSPVSSAGEDSLDQEPSSTVSIGSPEINIKFSIKDFAAKAGSSVWKGFIFMQDVAKFVTSAYKVSGQTEELSRDLPDTIQVCGRIIPDQVWDYLGKIKQSGNKELIIIRFQAANEEEAVAYSSFYSYLNSRKRYGVVSNYTKKIKDFYILPLASTSPVPMVLVPFDGPGLPSPRPHLLLGVIVRHKNKQVSSPVHQKKASLSKNGEENRDNSYTPPHEPRSYTPPLPTNPTLDQSIEEELDTSSSQYSDDKSSSKSNEVALQPFKNLYTVLNEIPNCGTLSLEKDDDKPYDPEQDIVPLSVAPPVAQKSDDTPLQVPDNLEKHKKILDALTRQVEETDRQVNALKQLISQPEIEAGSQSPNVSLDLNSVVGTGMSSFLDFPVNLKELVSSVQLKSHVESKTQTLGDVDMRVKTIFGEHNTEQTKDSHVPLNVDGKPLINEEGLKSPAATPPPTDEAGDSSSGPCPSDPRIKLRTNHQNIPFAYDSSVQEITHSQNVIPDVERKSQIFEMSKLSSVKWASKEPPPPGVDPPDDFFQEKVSEGVLEAKPQSSASQDASQHISSIYPQQSFSFPPHLPVEYSMSASLSNMNPFPPAAILNPPFPPPPIPAPILTPQKNNPTFEESWSNSDKWHGESSASNYDHARKRHPEALGYYSSERSANYNDQDVCAYNQKPAERQWERPQRYGHGKWDKHSRRSERFEKPQRGKRDFSYKGHKRS